jgi:hypothetical protein
VNILWVLILCSPSVCVSLGAYTSLVDCERELMPTQVITAACLPRDGI